jgi:predicted transcriptional regulator
LILLAGALMAWRWQTGWPPLEEEKPIEAPLTSLDEHRNRGIRSLLPQLTLVAVYEMFRDAKPIDLDALTEELRVPYAWVQESVDLLIEIGLLARAMVTQSDKTEREQLLPTHPADKIQLAEIGTLTQAPMKHWLENWEPATSKALKQFARNLDSKSSAEFEDVTIKNLI